jgi:hypothetical protein
VTAVFFGLVALCVVLLVLRRSVVPLFHWLVLGLTFVAALSAIRLIPWFALTALASFHVSFALPVWTAAALILDTAGGSSTSRAKRLREAAARFTHLSSQARNVRRRRCVSPS